MLAGAGFEPKGKLVKELGGGYDLFLSKNTLKRGYVHPSEPKDAKGQIDLGLEDSKLLELVFGMLKPAEGNDSGLTDDLSKSLFATWTLVRRPLTARAAALMRTYGRTYSSTHEGHRHQTPLRAVSNPRSGARHRGTRRGHARGRHGGDQAAALGETHAPREEKAEAQPEPGGG